MLTSLDRDESRKNSRAPEKNSRTREISRPEIWKFALEQMWALKCLRTKRDVFVLCRWLTPAASPDRLPWPPVMLLVSDYPSRPIPLVLPFVSQSTQFDFSHASVLVD